MKSGQLTVHDEGPDLLERLVLTDQTRLIDFEQLRLLNDQIKGDGESVAG